MVAIVEKDYDEITLAECDDINKMLYDYCGDPPPRPPTYGTPSRLPGIFLLKLLVKYLRECIKLQRSFHCYRFLSLKFMELLCGIKSGLAH